MPFSRRSFLSVTGLSTLGISAAVTRAWGQAPRRRPRWRRPTSIPARIRRSSKKWSASSHGNFARVREIVEKQPALCARLDGLGIRRLGNVHRRGRACRQQADCRLPVEPRRAADDLFRGDDGAARRGEGVRRGPARHPEDPWAARHHADVARARRRRRRRAGRAIPHAARRCGHPHCRRNRSPPADRDALVGKYVYGPGPRDYFTVDVDRDQLWHRSTVWPGAARPRPHSATWCSSRPACRRVKIAFAREGGKVTQLTVADPEVMVTARRA